MYIFTKTTGGVLVNYPNDTILTGGGGGHNDDKRTIQEIVPLGLIFRAPMRNYSKNTIVPTTPNEVLDDKKMDKLYKKVRPKK
jgi:hypothetical protein